MPGHLCSRLGGAALGLLAVLGGAEDRRIALVIGNSRYEGGAALTNPANDAKAVAEALRALQFQVLEKTDLEKKQDMDDALLEFHQALQGGGVGLFFYAGHGVQVEGNNFLLPTRENFRAEYEVKSKGLKADDVLGAMEEAGTTLNVLILDCCRDAPFTRSWKRSIGPGEGLSAMAAPQGTLIAFSTKAGATALDGEGSHSPYTEALLTELSLRPREGLEMKRIFQRTAQRVFAKTTQDPGLYLSGSFKDYYLVPGDGASPGNDPEGEMRLRLEQENAKLRAELVKIQAQLSKGQTSSQLLADLKNLQDRLLQLESRKIGGTRPTPVPVPTPQPESPGNREADLNKLENFLVGFGRSGESDDPRTSAAYFAPVVSNYYGDLNQNQNQIMAGHLQYVQKYPRRSYQPLRYKVLNDDGKILSVEIVTRFSVSGVNSRSGVSTSQATVRRTAASFEIIAIDEKIDFD